MTKERQRQEGEMLVRRMSDKAQKFYASTDPIEVLASSRDDEDGIRCSWGGSPESEYSFIELEAMFEELCDELSSDDDE